MKVVGLVSGGKDSCYNMVHCVAAGHEITCLANLRPREDTCHETGDNYQSQYLMIHSLIYSRQSHVPDHRLEQCLYDSRGHGVASVC